jgi:hypothetical protein
MGKTKQAEARIDELVRQLRNKEELLARAKPVDFAAVSENVTLRNELMHSHELIQHNQEIMDEQNRALQELHAYVLKLEDREAQLRGKVDLKVRELD